VQPVVTRKRGAASSGTVVIKCKKAGVLVLLLQMRALTRTTKAASSGTANSRASSEAKAGARRSLNGGCCSILTHRVGQNRICTPYMHTVCMYGDFSA